ncbi:DMT family transporter [Streptomyces sp. NBC_00320]|uniref:DMT family transporter n=1 Tax=Streptomyces sp. NBC_00320 TaxID=2975711 RepID=UPI000AEA80EB|nr:DMT family transporter [Streptomyces sp. NBC_00320]MCX5150458.1 DMT family transporter [Streptomyces sp. NBC_00320]
MSGERRGRGSLGTPALSCLMVLLLATGWVLSGKLVSDTPPLAVAAGRTAASFAVISAISALRPRTWTAIRVTGGRRGAVVLLAFLGFFAYYTGTLLGIDRIGASRVGLVVSLLPCITFVIGIVAFREQAGTRRVLGTLLAVAAALGYALEDGPARADAGTGVLVTGVLFALAGTFAYALYGYVYRKHMSDVPPLAALPAVTGAGTVMLGLAAAVCAPLGDISAAQWAAVAVLGAVLTAPVFVISHELILRKGPLFTSSVALVVPFLVRLGEWAWGEADAPGPASLLFLALCSAGVWMTVAPVRTPATEEEQAPSPTQTERSTP